MYAKFSEKPISPQWYANERVRISEVMKVGFSENFAYILNK